MAEGRTNAGGGGFNKSVIIVTAPTGSTVTCTKGTTVKTATEKNGEWWFKNLDIGTWTLKATLGGQTATSTVNITQFDVYRIAMSYFAATIAVTYPAGFTCTCSKDGEVLTAPDTSGSYAFTVTSAGIWTIKATGGASVKYGTAIVTNSGQTVNIDLRTLLLYKNGDEYTSITGGWKARAWAYDSGGSAAIPTLQKYGTYMHLTALSGTDTGGIVEISNDVDLTNFKTLKVNVSGFSQSMNASSLGALRTAFGVFRRSTTYAGTAYVATKLIRDFTNGDNVIDVSGLSGSYCIGFYIYSTLPNYGTFDMNVNMVGAYM